MCRARKQERGVALLLVILALLLLSAVGIGMLVSADSETAVAANYRDKQAALYGAQSGLQEARDRIKDDPFFDNVPAGLPGTGAALANIVYILNPAAGETVDPWNPASPYFDKDICTKVPAICTNGKPPSSGYSSTNNASGSLPANMSLYTNATGIPFKWARVMLKADNTIPGVPVGTPTGAQVCYDSSGHFQFPKPGSSYTTECVPAKTGALKEINLNAGNTGGSGYLNPIVIIDPPPVGGTLATATAQIAPDAGNEHLTSITLNNPGTGYKTPPNVVIDPPPLGGVQATATATIMRGGGPVASASLSSAGSPAGCYATNSSPAISVSGGGGGTGAAFNATMTAKTCVVSWSASGSCKAQKGNTVTATAAGGFTGTITFANGSGNVSSTAVTNPGTGITSAPTSISVSGCTGLVPTFTLGYEVSGITVTSGGNNYTSAPTLTFAPPSAGGTPTATATLGATGPNNGQVIAITITNPGSGYTTTPNISIVSVDGFGQNATATASMASTNHVTGFTITNPGSGYRVAPKVTITDASGTGAQAFASLQDSNVHYGQVLLVTALARGPGGSTALSEMEIATSYYNYAFKPSGALTLAGPSPTLVPPNSANMVVNGRDANSCGDASKNGPLPAIGVYDDPANPTNPTAVQLVTNAINGAKPQNFIGQNGTGDVHNVYNDIGSPAQAQPGLESFVQAIYDVPGAAVYASNPGSINWGTAANPAVDIVEGDLTITGNKSGYGILVVRGTLHMSGDFSWHGLILVVGDGNAIWDGGGNGQITGSIFIANTHGGSGTLVSPDVAWNGGGGNGIQYDHCWADNLLSRVPFTPQPAPGPLRVLSMRSLGN